MYSTAWRPIRSIASRYGSNDLASGVAAGWAETVVVMIGPRSRRPGCMRFSG